MPVTVELRTLHRAVEELRTVVHSLHGKYGDLPAVQRLRNDLERLELDVSDVGLLASMPTNPDVGPPLQMQTVSDEPYDPAMWADDADDEGLGGYHGGIRR